MRAIVHRESVAFLEKGARCKCPEHDSLLLFVLVGDG